MGDFERNFDLTAVDYDRIRPMYADEIYRDIFAYKDIGRDSQVLEIGMGTGKATVPFLDRQCRLTGIEPGENLAALARERLKDYSNLTIVNQTLQDYQCEDGTFDLIYAATAFHWIPEEYGYRRVFSLLKKGGAFARFAYHAGPDRGRRELAEEIQGIYALYMQPKKEYKVFGEAEAEKTAQTALAYGFTDIRHSLYYKKKDFTSDEYMALLTTYPDHMKLEEEPRRKLFEGIHRAIDRSGGTITIYYSMDLELARK